MNKEVREELGRLTSLLLDGNIAENEHRKLSDLLKESSANRKEYLEYIRLESLLHWESEDVASVETPKLVEEAPIFFRFPFWIGSVAAIFLAMSAIWWTNQPTNSVNSLIGSHNLTPLSSISKSGGDVLAKEQSFQRLSRSSGQKKFVTSLSSMMLHDKAKRAISHYLSADSSHGGVTEYFGPVKRWNRLHALLTPAENGILPASGSTMIGFEKMLVDMESQKAEIEETIQVLDVREAVKGVSGDNARIFAAVKFNQSFGESQEGAEFSITLQAFKKDADSSSHELVRTDEKLSSDRDPSTWSQVSSEMIIPNDAQFVVVSLTARKFGPDAVLANTSSYYADDLELFLSFDEKTTIGPI